MNAFPISESADGAIRNALERADRFRRVPVQFRQSRGHKEWLHFCIYGDDVDLLLNFSVVDDLRPGGGGELARLTLLAGRGRWDGDLISYDAGQWTTGVGEVSAEFPGGFVMYRGGRYFLQAELPDGSLSTRLYLEPVTMPSLVNNVQVGDGPPIHWMVAPRLLATGEATVAGQRHHFDRVPAYHDHNWGEFRWGRDFAWEWGFGLPREVENPWSVVFVRLSDRLHTRVMMQGLFVWHGHREARVFRGRELRIAFDGQFERGPECMVPGVMRLVHPATATDVPARVRIHAESRGDRVRAVFTSKTIGQVVIPNDDDLGVTVINEVQGDLSVEGVIRGTPFGFDTQTIFEFLGR